ncbi:TOG domain-containing protein [Entamoeba marina]
MDNPSAEDVDTRPLIERLQDKSWKIRTSAYVELTNKMSEVNNLHEYDSIYENIIKETNPLAMENGMLLFQKLLELTSDDNTKRIGKQVSVYLIEKGLIGRPKGKQIALDCLLLCCEIGIASDIFQQLNVGVFHKNTKINSEALNTILQILINFGPNIFSTKVVMQESNKWLLHKLKPVRVAAVKIVHYIFGFVQQDLLKEYTDLYQPAQKKRNRRLLGDEKKVTEQSINIEELKNLKKSFYQINDKTWKQKKEELQQLQQLLDNPRIDIIEDIKFWKVLLQYISDSNVPVCSTAVSCLLKLIRLIPIPHVISNQFNTTLILKLKEQSKPLQTNIFEILNVLLLTKITDISKSLEEVASSGNVYWIIAVFKWLSNFISIDKGEQLEVNKFISIIFKPLDSNSKEVRDCTTEVVISYMKKTQLNIVPLLKGINPERLKVIQSKINQFNNSEQITDSHISIATPTPSVNQNHPTSYTITPKFTTSPPQLTQNKKLTPSSGYLGQTTHQRIPPCNSAGLKGDSFTRPKGFQRAQSTTGNKRQTIMLMQGFRVEDNSDDDCISSQMLESLKSKDWERKQILTKNEQVLTIPKTDIICHSLYTKLNDSKKNMVKSILTIFEKIAIMLKHEFSRYSGTVISSMLSLLGDSNKLIRDTSFEKLMTIAQFVGVGTVFMQFSGYFQTDNIQLKQNILLFVNSNMKNLETKDVVIIKGQLKFYLRSLTDRKKEIRLAAEEVMLQIINIVGMKFVTSKLSLTGASQQQISDILKMIERNNKKKQVGGNVEIPSKTGSPVAETKEKSPRLISPRSRLNMSKRNTLPLLYQSYSERTSPEKKNSPPQQHEVFEDSTQSDNDKSLSQSPQSSSSSITPQSQIINQSNQIGIIDTILPVCHGDMKNISDDLLGKLITFGRDLLGDKYLPLLLSFNEKHEINILNCLRSLQNVHFKVIFDFYLKYANALALLKHVNALSITLNDASLLLKNNDSEIGTTLNYQEEIEVILRECGGFIFESFHLFMTTYVNYCNQSELIQVLLKYLPNHKHLIYNCLSIVLIKDTHNLNTTTLIELHQQATEDFSKGIFDSLKILVIVTQILEKLGETDFITNENIQEMVKLSQPFVIK